MFSKRFLASVFVLNTQSPDKEKVFIFQNDKLIKSKCPLTANK